MSGRGITEAAEHIRQDLLCTALTAIIKAEFDARDWGRDKFPDPRPTVHEYFGQIHRRQPFIALCVLGFVEIEIVFVMCFIAYGYFLPLMASLLLPWASYLVIQRLGQREVPLRAGVA